MIKTVVFDLDDTLVNTTSISKKVVKKIYARNLDKFGDIEADHIYRVASKAFDDLISDSTIPSPSAAILVWFEVFEKLNIQPHISTVVSLRKQMINEFSLNVEAVKNVDKVLTWLRAKNIKIGVLTNGGFMEQAEKLIRTGLDKKIDYLAGTDMTIAEKPNSKAFHHILTALNTNPKEAMMVGDSLENDVLGAIDIGMTGVLLISNWRNYSKEELLKADVILDDISELIDCVKESFSK